MPLTPRPLAPLALRLVEIPGIPRVRGVQAVGLARLPTLIRGGASPLRRAAEQHPAQHRDLLRQLRDPGIGLRERLLGPLGTLTPVRHISGVTGHRREGHVLQNTPSPSNTPRTAPGVSRTKPQPRRRPRLQTHAALTPHVTTGGHSDSARPPTGSPNTYGIPMCVVGILLFVGGVRGTVTPHGIAVLSGFGASGLGLAMLGASVSWVLQKWGLSWWRRITSSNSVEPYAGERQAPRVGLSPKPKRDNVESSPGKRTRRSPHQSSRKRRRRRGR